MLRDGEGSTGGSICRPRSDRNCCSMEKNRSLKQTTGKSRTPRPCVPEPFEAEVAARAVPGVTNSNGGGASASASTIALATSGGFSGAYRTSAHSCTASVIAGEGASMQRDYASHCTHYLEDLDDAETIGRLAGTSRGCEAEPFAAQGGQISGDLRPARVVDIARPFLRRDHRLGYRAQDELPSGQARAGGILCRA